MKIVFFFLSGLWRRLGHFNTPPPPLSPLCPNIMKRVSVMHNLSGRKRTANISVNQLIRVGCRRTSGTNWLFQGLPILLTNFTFVYNLSLANVYPQIRHLLVFYKPIFYFFILLMKNPCQRSEVVRKFCLSVTNASI